MGFPLRRLDSDTSAKTKPVEIYNPYLAARKEWDERYGEFITRARNWRTAAMISALVALLATGGLVWLTARSHVIPFVVLVDSLGRPVASGLVGNDRLRRAVIQDWIENVRLVTTDGIAQRRATKRQAYRKVVEMVLKSNKTEEANGNKEPAAVIGSRWEFASCSGIHATC